MQPLHHQDEYCQWWPLNRQICKGLASDAFIVDQQKPATGLHCDAAIQLQGFSLESVDSAWFSWWNKVFMDLSVLSVEMCWFRMISLIKYQIFQWHFGSVILMILHTCNLTFGCRALCVEDKRFWFFWLLHLKCSDHLVANKPLQHAKAPPLFQARTIRRCICPSGSHCESIIWDAFCSSLCGSVLP